MEQKFEQLRQEMRASNFDRGNRDAEGNGTQGDPLSTLAENIQDQFDDINRNIDLLDTRFCK